jgi:RNA polymerase sigma-70 factor (ECF subfamily)
VDRLLAKLSPKKRMVFVLFEIEGLPVDEIARVVGCPENTVWSRLHHARAEMLAMARKAEKGPAPVGSRRGSARGDEGEGETR